MKIDAARFNQADRLQTRTHSIPKSWSQSAGDFSDLWPTLNKNPSFIGLDSCRALPNASGNSSRACVPTISQAKIERHFQ